MSVKGDAVYMVYSLVEASCYAVEEHIAIEASIELVHKV